MAVYSKLLLSAGGGIVSANQQAEQDKKNATLLIGLGGTGIDAIRTIKTQVYSRLKPDDPDAVAPAYEHIRFLGVDTAEKSKGDAEENEDKQADALMALDDTESFSISNPNIKRAFDNPQSIQMRDELSWLRWEDIKAPDLGTAGAGGIRQVGRFMMMDKSQAFMSRLEQEINAAKSGLAAPNVYVHIFSGLSGGTGAGCFLDVCYMVKHVAKKLGGVTVCGYFFLPDVNLSRIPMTTTGVREYIPVNGYAAMQELDYCMNLQQNGGGFTQTYKNHIQVEWREAPVDMCHLVCATNSDGDVRPNAYDYAMNVTAEYVMNFLAKPDAKFDLGQHMSNFTQMVNTADTTKIIGSQLAYVVIGASCASIPLRQINTYLATELFTQFSQICKNLPTKGDVEQLAVNALASGANSLSAIYDSLYREVMADTSADYNPFPGDWKEIRDMGNAELVRNYTDQKAAKLNVLVKNGKSMKSEGNQKSLIGRIRAQLDALVRSINFGPMFAYKMVSAAESHNLLNILDGLLEQNTSRKNQEAAQHTLRYDDYERAKADFESRRSRGFLDNDQKRFGDYEYYLMLAMQHELYMEVYRQLEDVLSTLRDQLEEAVANYYIKLNRVMQTLVESFESNRAALADEKILQGTGSFSIPMMTIEELKKSLDAEIEKVNIPNMLDAFMRLLQSNEDVWITEDEKKIVRLVNDFFVKTAFSGFADRTITSFLKDKYKLDGDAELALKIYNDWMKKLTANAKPLFYFNPSVWDEAQTSKLAFLSFPKDSAPIMEAANMLNKADSTWGANGSSVTDRIFVMCSACALPLSAYNNCAEYERQCFSTVGVGRHYYEGKDVPGMSFNDWRKLPSLTPQSLLNLNTAPDFMKTLVGDARKIYDDGRKFNLFTDDNVICQPDPEAIEKLNALVAKVPAIVEKLNKPAVPKAKEFIAQIQEARNIASIPTKDTMPNDGFAKEMEKKLSVQKDHFVSSPAYQLKVEEHLKTLREVDAAAQAAIDALNAKIEGLNDNQGSDFLNAVFTGVITVKGITVSYEDPEDIFGDPVILSKMGGEFPFGAIPLYQGLVSYKAMDEDTKKTITQVANDRMNEGAMEIAEACTALKAILTVPKLKGWVEVAKNFTECNEIIAFLKTVQEQFKSFCLINGIE